MEGHAEMDMSVADERPFFTRLRSPEGLTAISHYFVMDWLAVWKDIAGGLLVAGAVAALVPDDFWKALFLENHPTLALFWGPLMGPLVAIVSFVCSVGNVPLAAVLWNGGISFGGVVAFVFADLIILPILDIYRRYYGAKVALYLLGTLYLTMAAAGLAVEFIFQTMGLVPKERQAVIVQASVTWNADTILNIVFLAVASLLVWRFLRTGGPQMMGMIGPPVSSDRQQVVANHGTQ
jgi:uncharacterized membrane protein YraQ (UPF0718 family)